MSDDSLPRDFWDDDTDLPDDADLAETAPAQCPYCGEEVELFLDPGGGRLQEYVEDCEVCCQPWSVQVQLDDNGQAWVSLQTLDEG